MLENPQKKAIKKLAKANKGGTFAPATTHTFINKLTRIPNQDRKFIFEKRFAKACEIRKRMLHLHPAKQAKFLDRLIRYREEKGMKNSLKKLQK